MSDDYSVGYGRPPRETRFKRGTSGNPAGRPKQLPSLKMEIKNELAELVLTREAGQEVAVTKLKLVAKTIVAAAIGGDNWAVPIVDAASEIKDEPSSEAPEDQEILDDYASRVRQRKEREEQQTTHQTNPRNSRS